MTDTENDDGRVRPFADWLREHNRGATHNELSDALVTLTRRVKDTGKVGTVTLTIKVEPMKKAADGMVLVTDKIAMKLPEHDRPAAYWFIDDDGNLVRDDPNQLAFDSLTVVEDTAGDPIHVDPATGEVVTPIAKEKRA